MGTLISLDSHHRDAQRAAFDARYGDGSFEQLLERLAQPCISFAQIAAHFGVTRERVRQWHLQWLPQAPTGLQRRRMCASYQVKRRLMRDPLFRAFHRHAREAIGAERIRPIPSRRGFRPRAVRIDQFVVALRDAVASPPRYRGRADFIYFRLPDGQFLFTAAEGPILSQPLNTFAALDAPRVVARTQAFVSKEQSL